MALAADVVWEVRTTGDDNNGGGFNSSSAGTDYSQQASAQLTVTDAATSGVGSTTLTSATGGFTAAMVGNVVHLYSGTNLTAGWYEITGYTDGNTVTLDRAPDDGVGGVSGATCKVGGALASPGGLGEALANAVTDDQKTWIQSGTYTVSTSTANVSGGTLVLPAFTRHEIEGYGATRGDGGTPPVIVAGAITSAVLITLKGDRYNDPQIIRNVKVDGNSVTTIDGISGGTSYFGSKAIECVAVNCRYGFTGKLVCLRCEGSDNSYSFYNSNNIRCSSKRASSYGYYGYLYCEGCVSSADQVGYYPAPQYGSALMGCTAYNCTGDGFLGGSRDDDVVVNCLAVGNGGYGFNATQGQVLVNCSGYNNSSGNYGASATIIDWLTITGDPFVDAAGGDFRLNDTAGAGAVLRGAGLGVYGQTDNQDVGAVQHSDPMGGGGGDVWPYIRPRRIGA